MEQLPAHHRNKTKQMYAKLDAYKKYGAPKIPHIPMTKHEMNIARNLFCEGYDFPDQSEIFSQETG